MSRKWKLTGSELKFTELLLATVGIDSVLKMQLDLLYIQRGSNIFNLFKSNQFATTHVRNALLVLPGSLISMAASKIPIPIQFNTFRMWCAPPGILGEGGGGGTAGRFRTRNSPTPFLCTPLLLEFIWEQETTITQYSHKLEFGAARQIWNLRDVVCMEVTGEMKERNNLMMIIFVIYLIHFKDKQIVLGGSVAWRLRHYVDPWTLLSSLCHICQPWNLKYRDKWRKIFQIGTFLNFLYITTGWFHKNRNTWSNNSLFTLFLGSK